MIFLKTMSANDVYDFRQAENNVKSKILLLSDTFWPDTGADKKLESLEYDHITVFFFHSSLGYDNIVILRSETNAASQQHVTGQETSRL